MPKYDITGRAAQNAARIVSKAIAEFDEMVPFGPGMAQFSPEEVRARINKASPDALRQLMTEIGVEQVVKALQQRSVI